MKRFAALLIAVIFIIGLTGCAKDAGTVQSTGQSSPVKAVKVQEAEMSKQAVALNYIGTVDSKEIVKYSFKVPGQIGRIYVKKGDKIGKGTKLAELDKQDLEFQVAAAKAIMNTAELNIKKAEDALNYAHSLYDKVNSLYMKGSVSKNQYEQVQLQKEVSAAEYEQAKSQYEAAKTDYEFKSDLVANSVIYSEDNGTIVDKVFSENERVGAYMPVVIVRSGAQVINVGIPQQELALIKVGSMAIVDVDGEKAEGVVTNIAEAPDITTRTYTAEITVKSKVYRLGSIAKISIGLGDQSGVWIPMSIVLSSGESYIFVVKDERAYKRIVEIEKISDDKVMVKGVGPGELIVISGMKNLDDCAKVRVEE